MKIKTYLVRSLSDAVEKIKKEMGPEAVILSTRKVDALSHPMAPAHANLEVTAALYPAAQQYIPEPVADSFEFSTVSQRQQAAFQETVLQAATSNEQRVSSDIRISNKAPAKIEQEEVVVSPLQEYFAKQQQQKIEEMEAAILTVCKNLNQHNLQASVIEELSENLLSEEQEFDLAKCEELSAVHLMQKLPKPLPFKLEKMDATHLAFVGPTGSGKTTTLMKLAKKYKNEGCESLAIVSIDFDSLHREEPLRRFAEENSIPFYLINHESQLVQNFSKFANYEVMLFDTEGCSPYDNERMTRLAKTCESLAPVQTALVLPTHLGYGDLFTIIKRFSATRYDRLILTKLDETEHYGNLFQASFFSGVPLAYFATGQKIPEDFEEATLERVMDCLFNFSARDRMPELSVTTAIEEVQTEEELEIPAEQVPISIKAMPEGFTFI